MTDRQPRLGRWPGYPEALLTGFGVLGLVLFVLLYDRAFPSAALDLALSRAEIARRATAYVEGLGYDLAGSKFVLTFHEAWLPSVYLQQTLGIVQTSELARREGLPLWLWEARWFKPLQKPELDLSLMPDGTVVALSHSVLEDAPGADIPQDRARALAETYLVQDRGWDLAGWELVSASTQAQPGGRSDHYFAWKRANWDVGSSELRLAVDILGDEVGGYGFWLQVPEAFTRHYAEQRARAGFISSLSYYLGVGGFGLIALVYCLLGYRRGVLSWKGGLAVGLAVGLVELLNALNAFLLRKASYGTTQDYGVFWIEQVIDVLIAAGSIAGVVMILWMGGRYLARKAWKRQDKVLARNGDRWVSLAASSWRGLMLGGIHAGYAVLFYLLATQVLGGWTPMGTPAVNLYATPLPFLAPLAAGVTPAISEEFLFRLVGIGIVLVATGKRWLAVLVPGVLWAFAHLTYVRDPIYMRGVELTFVALLYGWALLRFDLATTAFAHLAYNVGITALPFLRSQHPYFVANGALVLVGLLAPLVPGAVRALRRGSRRSVLAPPVTIRPATAQDVPRLSELWPQEADWAAWIESPSTTVVCLCTPEEVAGAAAGRVGSDRVGWIVALAIAPQWRRRYWGSRLAEAIGERLRARGARSLQVMVPWRDPAAARFWDEQGWGPSAVVYGRRDEGAADAAREIRLAFLRRTSKGQVDSMDVQDRISER
jgi:ribosomal protein S18 acetylase RimI-like enzyme/membrane protease YdiL (CAAX protease family)